MHSAPSIRWGLLILGFVFAGSAGVTLAAAAETAAPAPAPAPSEVKAHQAKGEAWFDGKWSPVRDLFAAYRAAQGETDAVREKDKAARDRQAEIQKTLAQSFSQYQQDKAAIDADKAKAVAEGAAAQKVLARQAPLKPSRYENMSGYGSAGGFSTSSGADLSARMAKFEKAKAEWDADQAKAKADISAAQAKYKDGEKRLVELLANRKTNDTALNTERQKLMEAGQARTREIGAITARRQALATALRDVPEQVLLAAGVVVWKNDLHSPEELQAAYDKLLADIEAVRAAEKTKATGLRQELPKDWRHPQQGEADELKALLAKVKNGKA